MTPTDKEIMRLRHQVDELSDRLRLVEEGVLGARNNRYRRLGLTLAEASVLALLMKREAVTCETIYSVLYGNNADDGPNHAIIKVWIAKLRKKLALEISTRWGSKGSGGSDGLYSLSNQSKRLIEDRLRALNAGRAA